MIDNLDRIVDLVELHWPQKQVLVLGDVMLDKYIWGDVERISPEAPVPVVRAKHNSEQPGGAANVAMNIACLGAKVRVIGFAGNDDDRVHLESLLAKSNIDSTLVPVEEFPTVSKLRILAGNQQMLRLDVERKSSLPDSAYDSLWEAIQSHLPQASVVILSDYAKGVLSPRICRDVIDAARGQSIPVLVDPKTSDLSRYSGATTICPNLHELQAAVRTTAVHDVEGLLDAAENLPKDLDLKYLTVTLSEKGIAVLRDGGRYYAPAVARQVFDVSGAGDTVISILALCTACNLPVESAVQLANVAAGVVVSKVGTVPIYRHELIAALSPDLALHAEEKVLSRERMLSRVSAWRANGQSIVFTNGCFDLLHIGHITVLERARQEGDRLIVGLNSDGSIKRLKGESRPIVGQHERAQVLAALAAVDAVVLFEEDTPIELMESFRPDVIVKGGDYTDDTVVGASLVRSWGGRVKIVPIVEGFSTTKLIEKSTRPT
jgi:D-beta-D-heptose 7-phosphate kinase / D-beta-D-heptose 1-phosphate adenosyltransferase